jgi:3-oxoacyl-[acyl-carrier-protein] synthase-1
MDMLKWLYHNRVGDYPKYYKMDPMTKLGFLASELLLAAEGGERFAERTDRAVVIVGRSSSICADRLYQQTIQDADNYFPSPAAFIYTLPNIVAGEIAIRNIYRNETLYVAHESADGVIPLMTQMLTAPGVESVVGGWVEMEDTGSFDATLYIIE